MAFIAITASSACLGPKLRPSGPRAVLCLGNTILKHSVSAARRQPLKEGDEELPGRLACLWTRGVARSRRSPKLVALLGVQHVPESVIRREVLPMRNQSSFTFTTRGP